MIDLKAISERYSDLPKEGEYGYHFDSENAMRLAADIDALIVEVERLQQPLRCTCCGAPDEVHVQDTEDLRLWKIWMPDPVYPLWGTLHAKVLRRLGD